MITNQPLKKVSIIKGFTLVELLVAMAIIIFMLSIMSQAFVIATTCMSGLKGAVDLLDKGRPVLSVMQKDLSAYHFDGMRRLSDEDFWQYGPPIEGYFKIYQGNTSTVEGTTSDGVTYQRSSLSSDHRLSFTSRLAGKNIEDFYVSNFETGPNYSDFTTKFNGNTSLQNSKNSLRFDFTPGVIHSQWAEIGYFTKDNNRKANGTPLMDLYRQQKLILPSNSEILPVLANQLTNFKNFSCYSDGTNLHFNSPSELTDPSYRAFFPPLEFTLYPKSDLLLSDVISFDVRILTDTSLKDFMLLADVKSVSGYTCDFTSPANGFDTWTKKYPYDFGDESSGKWQPTKNTAGSRIPFWAYTTNNIPVKGLKINAIQISIRVWDEKSQKAREFKLIQRL